mgnify:CR=1 FL=1
MLKWYAFDAEVGSTKNRHNLPHLSETTEDQTPTLGARSTNGRLGAARAVVPCWSSCRQGPAEHCLRPRTTKTRLCFLSIDMSCYLINGITSLENDVIDLTHSVSLALDHLVCCYCFLHDLYMFLWLWDYATPVYRRNTLCAIKRHKVTRWL